MSAINRAKRVHLNGSVILLEWNTSETRRFTIEATTPFGTYTVTSIDGDDAIWSSSGMKNGTLVKGGFDGGKVACQNDFTTKVTACIGADPHPKADANAEFWKNDAIDKAANIANVYGEQHVAEEILRLKTSTFGG
jgi:hypothetical protein